MFTIIVGIGLVAVLSIAACMWYYSTPVVQDRLRGELLALEKCWVNAKNLSARLQIERKEVLMSIADVEEMMGLPILPDEREAYKARLHEEQLRLGELDLRIKIAEVTQTVACERCKEIAEALRAMEGLLA